MRKTLLATLYSTTALVAAGAFASAAMADEMMAEPISVSVGGHYFVALSSMSGDDGVGEPLANTHSTAMAQDFRLVVSGSTTLDNGMTVGLTAKIDVASAEDPGSLAVDERFITIGGAFGRLQLGSVESARQQTTTFAPSAAGMMGINTPYFHFAPAYITRYNDGIGNEDALRLVYFTPSMNGFSLGVSYAPDDAGRGQYGGSGSGDFGKPAEDEDGEYKNHIGVGATFSQGFAGGSVSLSAGYEAYDAEVPSGMSCATVGRTNCDPETVQFGLSISFGDYSFGGGWQGSDTSDTTENSVMDLGVGWGSGPMRLAAMYGQASEEVMGGGDKETTRYGVNGSYALGAGVDVQAQLDFGEYDSGAMDPTKDFDWVQFMIGTSVSF